MQTRPKIERNRWAEPIDSKPCILVALLLPEDVQHLTMLIDGSPDRHRFPAAVISYAI